MAELVPEKSNYSAVKVEQETDSCKQPKVNIVETPMTTDSWVQDNGINVNCGNVNYVPYEPQPVSPKY